MVGLAGSGSVISGWEQSNETVVFFAVIDSSQQPMKNHNGP